MRTWITSAALPGILKPKARSSAGTKPLKNRVLLENHYLPGAREDTVATFIDHYNHHRYHKSLGNITPADVYLGKAETILNRRQDIKAKTIEKRRLLHRKTTA